MNCLEKVDAGLEVDSRPVMDVHNSIIPFRDRYPRLDVVLLTDPRVRTVIVEECGEPLVDVLAGRDVRVRLDGRERNPSEAYRLLRAGAVARLSQAAAALPAGLGLLVVEGWRDPDDQHRRFTAYLRRLADQHPELDDVALRDCAAAFVSPVEVAPHCTGGAVDLTLVELVSGTELDMGGAVNAHRSGDDGSCPFAAQGLPDRADRLAGDV